MRLVQMAHIFHPPLPNKTQGPFSALLPNLEFTNGFASAPLWQLDLEKMEAEAFTAVSAAELLLLLQGSISFKNGRLYLSCIQYKR